KSLLGAGSGFGFLSVLFAAVGASIGCVAVVMFGAPSECRVDFEVKVPKQCVRRSTELRYRVAFKRNGLRDYHNQSETGGKSAAWKEFVRVRRPVRTGRCQCWR